MEPYCYLFLVFFSLFLDDQSHSRSVLNDQIRAFISHLPDRREKAVSAPGDSLDVVLVATIIAERPPESGNVLGEIILFDERVWPDGLDQLALLKHMSALLHQRQENVERLRRQGQRGSLMQQQTLGDIYSKLIEFVEMIDRPIHKRLQNFYGNSSELLKYLRLAQALWFIAKFSF